jgi:F0F1-type ATP synthase assembly protein I
MDHFFTTKRVIILIFLLLLGLIVGRLLVRAVINFLVGGTLFGGNLL